MQLRKHCTVDPGAAGAAVSGEGGDRALRGPAGGRYEEPPALGSRWRRSPTQRQHWKSYRYVPEYSACFYMILWKLFYCFTTFLSCKIITHTLVPTNDKLLSPVLVSSWPQPDAQAEWGGLQQPGAVAEESHGRSDGLPGWAPWPQREGLWYCSRVQYPWH